MEERLASTEAFLYIGKSGRFPQGREKQDGSRMCLKMRVSVEAKKKVLAISS
jgi:hypothetical protein